MHEGLEPNWFDYWANTSLHLILVKNSMLLVIASACYLDQFGHQIEVVFQKLAEINFLVQFEIAKTVF